MRRNSLVLTLLLIVGVSFQAERVSGQGFSISPGPAICTLVCPPECKRIISPTQCRCDCRVGIEARIDGAGKPILPAIDLKVTFPDIVTINRMPPVPNDLQVVVPVTVTLTNRSTEHLTLTASTPCDVHNWTVTRANGTPVESDQDGMCIQVFQTVELPAGKSIRSDSAVILNGHIYSEADTYRIKYDFWHVQFEKPFKVQIVQ